MTIRKPLPTNKVSIKKRKRISVFFVFLVFSTFLWLIIKLSNEYALTTEINIKLTELPSDVWIKSSDIHQKQPITITTNGFKLINLVYLRSNPLEAVIPLSAVPYRKQSQFVYYISMLNLKEVVANQLGVNEDEIEFHDSELYLNIEAIASKKTAIHLKNDFSYKEQFGQYGAIIISPDSVDVFAPQHILDTLTSISTAIATQTNIDQNFDGIAELSFNPDLLRPALNAVNYSVAVERYTESSVRLKVVKPSKPLLKLFPDYVEVFYSVAMKDFGKINSDQFFVRLDTTGLASRKQFLSVEVFQKPDNIGVVRIQPEFVEYLILK